MNYEIDKTIEHDDYDNCPNCGYKTLMEYGNQFPNYDEKLLLIKQRKECTRYSDLCGFSLWTSRIVDFGHNELASTYSLRCSFPKIPTIKTKYEMVGKTELYNFFKD